MHTQPELPASAGHRQGTRAVPQHPNAKWASDPCQVRGLEHRFAWLFACSRLLYPLPQLDCLLLDPTAFPGHTFSFPRRLPFVPGPRCPSVRFWFPLSVPVSLPTLCRALSLNLVYRCCATELLPAYVLLPARRRIEVPFSAFAGSSFLFREPFISAFASCFPTLATILLANGLCRLLLDESLLTLLLIGTVLFFADAFVHAQVAAAPGVRAGLDLDLVRGGLHALPRQPGAGAASRLFC